MIDYLTLDRNLVLDMLVRVNWTNNNCNWSAQGVICKINQKSVRVRLTEGIEGHYPRNQEIIVPRALSKNWSVYNGIVG